MTGSVPIARGRRLRSSLLVLVLASVGALVAASLPSPASAEDRSVSPVFVGAPYSAPGAVYTQNFPDPSVVFDPVTSKYYAFATTTGGVNVPVMSSPDTVTWTARARYNTPHYNANGENHDALPDGRLGLFYSGGKWNSDTYSVGLAVCGPLKFSWAPVCVRGTPGRRS